MSLRDAGKELWYHKGLKFSCTQCGRCCKGPNPGHVWVSLTEISAIAEHLELTVNEFGHRYLCKVGPRYSLIENKQKDCVFWSDDVGCTIYKVRPDQCRQYPFWPELLDRRTDWDREAKQCPGMNQGYEYDLIQIQSIVAGQTDTRSRLEAVETSVDCTTHSEPPDT